MSGRAMQRTRANLGVAARVLRLGLFLASGLAALVSATAGSVEVTYLANEGFLLAGGGSKVLVDALFGQGLRGYEVVPPELRDKLERGEPPFDGVALVLATHHHADHFDPHAVSRFLLGNAAVVLVTTEEAVERLRGVVGGRFADIAGRVRGVSLADGEVARLEIAGVGLELFGLTHGDLDPPVPNLGFGIEIGGWRAIHLGDTVAGGAELRRALAGRQWDVALIPFWYLLDESGREAVAAEVAARAVVPMHLPDAAAPADYFGAPESRQALLAALAGLPDTVLLAEPMGFRTFAADAPTSERRVP